jgi:hypothetical protein
VFGEAPVTGPWTELRPQGSFENGALRPITDAEGARVRFVAQSDEEPLDGLPLALVDPPSCGR